MALQGTLDTFALPDVLRLLAATKKTGRLRLTGARGTGSAWVVTGEVVGIEATHAPHATEPVDALFELLRFEDGSFTFDADAEHSDPVPPVDVESLLVGAEALLDEWRTIEVVVPSMDAWVTLCAELPAPEVTIDQDRWTTLVAVGAGATVRRLADDLSLAELPVSRAVKDLVETGLAELQEAAPMGAGFAPPLATAAPVAPTARPTALPPRPLLVSEADQVDEAPALPVEPAPVEELAGEPQPPAETDVPRGPRAARRVKPLAAEPAAAPAERFVPLDLPGHATASYDAAPEPEPTEADDLAAAFPGLAHRLSGDLGAAEPIDEDDLADQLASLPPRAAEAVRAAAAATTDEEREAALSEAEAEGDGEDEPLNRGLLLKFLSSVKS